MTAEQPVLLDAANPDKVTLLAADGTAIQVDKILGVRGHELRVIQGAAITKIPAYKLHMGVRKHYQMATTEAELAESLERQSVDDVVRAQEAVALRQQNAQITAQQNAEAGKAIREAEASKVAAQSAAQQNSAMAAYQRQLSLQPAAPAAPSGEAQAMNKIAEELRLQRLAAEAQAARAEGRSFYISPADARKLGF